MKPQADKARGSKTLLPKNEAISWDGPVVGSATSQKWLSTFVIGSSLIRGTFHGISEACPCIHCTLLPGTLYFFTGNSCLRVMTCWLAKIGARWGSCQGMTARLKKCLCPCARKWLIYFHDTLFLCVLHGAGFGKQCSRKSLCFKWKSSKADKFPVSEKGHLCSRPGCYREHPVALSAAVLLLLEYDAHSLEDLEVLKIVNFFMEWKELSEMLLFLHLYFSCQSYCLYLDSNGMF